MKTATKQKKLVAKPTKPQKRQAAKATKTAKKITSKKKKSKGPKMAKIEAKPLTENQILEFVKYYNEYKSFPGSKIPCNMTGKLTTCVGPWMVKKVKEYGGAENLLRKYKCRGALKHQKETLKPVSKNKKRRQVLKDMKDEQKNWDIPKMCLDAPLPMTDAELSEATQTVCMRPDIFLDNDRFCDGCEFYDVCTNANRRLKSTPKKRK